MTKAQIKRTYWENGNIKTEERYVDGIRNGLSKTYLIDGRLLTEKNYKDGLLHGKCKDYSSIDDKNLISEKEYKNGELVSYMCYYKGKKHLKAYYDSGRAKKYIHFDEEGKIQRIENYCIGVADGKFIENIGGVTIVTPYSLGYVSGKLKHYADNMLLYDVDYIDGMVEGKQKFYCKVGLKQETQYKEGYIDGKQKIYFDDGKSLEVSRSFEGGYLHGYVNIYEKSGETKSKRKYERGRLEKVIKADKNNKDVYLVSMRPIFERKK